MMVLHVQTGKAYTAPLPARLKTALEAASGYSMDDVAVHYNSAKPAQLQALAYAQGTHIYLAHGQEQYLAHEAWHVVQQKQGRVKATAWLNGAAINTHAALEQEADVMGALLLQPAGLWPAYTHATRHAKIPNPVVQRMEPLFENAASANIFGAPNDPGAGRAAFLAAAGIIKPTLTQLQGFDVNLQRAIIKYLDGEVKKMQGPEVDVVRLCSIELQRDQNNQFSFNLVKPVPIESGLVNKELPDYYNTLVADQINLQEAIRMNVETTLRQSGQLDYLRAAGLPDNNWGILVDLHFYYRRPNEQIGFHRDTIGHTLFVNLSYNNKKPVYAPELIFDGNDYGNHYQRIKNNLPPVFLDEIRLIMQSGGDNIHGGRVKTEKLWERPDPAVEAATVKIPENSILSWIDELYNHTTPYLGRRNKEILTTQVREWNKKERASNGNQNAIKYDAIDLVCIYIELYYFNLTAESQLEEMNLTKADIARLSKGDVDTTKEEILSMCRADPLLASKLNLPGVSFSKDMLFVNNDFNKNYSQAREEIFMHFWPLDILRIADLDNNNNQVFQPHLIKPRPFERQMSFQLEKDKRDFFDPVSGKRQFLRSWVMSYKK